MKIKKRCASDRVFYFLVWFLIIFGFFITLLPFMYVISVSFSDIHAINRGQVGIWPVGFNLDGYKQVLGQQKLWRAYYNTLWYTVVGTVLNIVFTVIAAYPLSKKYLPNRRFWIFFIIFTMYFSGGMIPNYLLINNWLKLSNTIWALILPPAMSAYNLIIVRNFFESIPDSLEESARIDGARETTVLFKIVVPLSMPVLATVSLWCIVGHWNAWYDCMLYIRDDTKYVLQYTLQRILLDGQVQDLDHIGTKVNTETMKMASIVVSILPIMIIYPFVQKYFTKGVMIGAVKG